MGYWGWRPLISALFICVWIIGCNIISGAAPLLSPTSQPFVTLTLRKTATRAPSATQTAPPATTTERSAAPAATATAHTYTVRPGDTLLGIALDFGLNVTDLQAANPAIDPLALQVSQALIIPPPGQAVASASTPIGLMLDPPLCYDLITGSTLCMGKIVNSQREAIQQARIQVGLLDAAGALVAEATTDIDQRGIPPGEMAPYSVIIKTRDYAETSALLLNADFAPLPEDLLLLDLVDEQVEVINQRYRVNATLLNRSNNASGPTRLVLTLLDAEGRVVGFRVLNSEQNFEPGARHEIVIEALVQADAESVRHHLYAEARRL